MTLACNQSAAVKISGMTAWIAILLFAISFASESVAPTDECALLEAYAFHEASGIPSTSFGPVSLSPGVVRRLSSDVDADDSLAFRAERQTHGNGELFAALSIKLESARSLDCRDYADIPDQMEWILDDAPLGLQPPLTCHEDHSRAPCRPYRIEMSRAVFDTSGSVAIAYFSENRNQMHCNPSGYLTFQRQGSVWRVARKWTKPCDDL